MSRRPAEGRPSQHHETASKRRLSVSSRTARRLEPGSGVGHDRGARSVHLAALGVAGHRQRALPVCVPANARPRRAHAQRSLRFCQCRHLLAAARVDDARATAALAGPLMGAVDHAVGPGSRSARWLARAAFRRCVDLRRALRHGDRRAAGAARYLALVAWSGLPALGARFRLFALRLRALAVGLAGTRCRARSTTFTLGTLGLPTLDAGFVHLARGSRLRRARWGLPLWGGG